MTKDPFKYEPKYPVQKQINDFEKLKYHFMNISTVNIISFRNAPFFGASNPVLQMKSV